MFFCCWSNATLLKRKKCHKSNEILFSNRPSKAILACGFSFLSFVWIVWIFGLCNFDFQANVDNWTYWCSISKKKKKNIRLKNIYRKKNVPRWTWFLYSKHANPFQSFSLFFILKKPTTFCINFTANKFHSNVFHKSWRRWLQIEANTSEKTRSNICIIASICFVSVFLNLLRTEWYLVGMCARRHLKTRFWIINKNKTKTKCYKKLATIVNL